jgi:hypothetical protein
MRKLTIAASAIAFLGVSSFAALADEITGQIQTSDPAASTVTLADGSTYKLPEGFDAASLKPGMSVWIEYAPGDGGMLASAIAAQGAIQNVDATARTVTLADGTSFVLPEGVDPATLQVGQNVHIEFSADANGQLMASSVEQAG